jgi:DNA-binding HxlR family transcriptional regulator
MSRTYDDPCGLARALNLVGERWALLIVRELLLGPKRFSDLRRGLPGASQSVLTQRLGELERAGVVRRRTLEPPASASAYELTGRGRELEPVLLRLSDWGSRTAVTSGQELSVDALALAMRTTFDPAAAGDLRITAELRMDGDRLTVTVRNGKLDVRRGAGATPPDAVLETTAAELRATIFGGRKDRKRDPLSRLLRSFPRPAAA